MKALLLALLRGSRNSALADDPELGYMNAVDLRVVFFGEGLASEE